jgi:hypothetical protein
MVGMKSHLQIALWAGSLMLLGAAPGFSQNNDQRGVGRAIVTLLPKHEGGSPLQLSEKDLTAKIGGSQATITNWKPLRTPEDKLEFVLLIDSSALTSLGTQFNSIAHFINGLPAGTKASIAYMENGRAVLGGELSADHARVLRELHLPGGSSGSDANIYFCLSDLAKHWPSTDRSARREVLMVTDGIESYHQEFDPADPYVMAAIDDSIRAGMVVYSIFWQNQGSADLATYENSTGQTYLLELAQATGGRSFWQGMGNPVSFVPFLDELTRRIQNQYELDFSTHFEGKARIEVLKLKLKVPGTEVDAPQQVMVAQGAAAQM